MRILQVVQRRQQRGAEVFAHQLTAMLRERGHDVQIHHLFEDGFTSVGGCLSAKKRIDIRSVNPVATAGKLAAAVRRFRPDVVQLNGGSTPKYGALVRAATGNSTMWIYRNIGDPSAWVSAGWQHRFYRLVMRRMDGIVALTDAFARELQRMYAPKAPITVIPNGVDAASVRPVRSREDVRSGFSVPWHAPLILFIGGMSREKRPDLALRIFAECRRQVPEAHLIMCGDGRLRGSLEAACAASAEMTAVRFCGSSDEIGSMLGAADVLLLCSDTEGMPGVLLEAGLARLPAVATAVGAVPDIIKHRETGFLVERGDVQGAAAALVEVLTDSASRYRLGVAAQSWVRERYLMDQIAREYVRFYQAVVARGAEWTLNPVHLAQAGDGDGKALAQAGTSRLKCPAGATRTK